MVKWGKDMRLKLCAADRTLHQCVNSMIRMSRVLLQRAECLLLLCASCLAGCRQETTVQDVPVVSVSLKGGESGMPFDLSEMVGTPHRIVLQTDAVLAPVAALKYVRGRYYLTDLQRKTIYAFNDSGEILLELSRSGRAEYEYVQMLGFDVNPANGEISVYDSATFRFIVYSEDGDFLRVVKPDRQYGWLRDFAVLEDGTYLTYTPDYLAPGYPSGLFALDRDGRFVRSLSVLDGDIRHNVMSEPYVNFRRLGDGTVTVRSEQDKNDVYHIGPDGKFTTACHFDFDVTLSQAVRESENPSSDDSSYYYFLSWFETDHWLGLVVEYLRERVLVYYDKETGTCHYGRTEKGRVKPADLLVKGKEDPYSFMFSAGDRLMYVKYTNGASGMENPEIIVYPERRRGGQER